MRPIWNRTRPKRTPSRRLNRFTDRALALLLIVATLATIGTCIASLGCASSQKAGPASTQRQNTVETSAELAAEVETMLAGFASRVERTVTAQGDVYENDSTAIRIVAFALLAVVVIGALTTPLMLMYDRWTDYRERRRNGKHEAQD